MAITRARQAARLSDILIFTPEATLAKQELFLEKHYPEHYQNFVSARIERGREIKVEAITVRHNFVFASDQTYDNPLTARQYAAGADASDAAKTQEGQYQIDMALRRQREFEDASTIQFKVGNTVYPAIKLSDLLPYGIYQKGVNCELIQKTEPYYFLPEAIFFTDNVKVQAWFTPADGFELEAAVFAQKFAGMPSSAPLDANQKGFALLVDMYGIEDAAQEASTKFLS